MSAQEQTKTTVPGAEACPEQTVGVPDWSEEQSNAWSGFHAVHSRVVKDLEHDLNANHGIGLSGYNLLARLARSEHGGLRMSDLADAAQLSPSRASRLVTQLERDGYIERRSCETDSRVVYAALTAAGLEYLADVHGTYVERVERGFFGQLSESEIATLAQVWNRLA